MNVILVTLYYSFLILASIRNAIAPPTGPKIMIDVDLSSRLPAKIKQIPSKDNAHGFNYTVQHSRRHTHIIGNITDGDHLLLLGQPNAISRYLYIVTETDGTIQMRVTTKTRVSDVLFLRRIHEFIKRPGDHHFNPLVRRHITLNILSQQRDEDIDVQLIPDWSAYELTKGHQLLPSHYSIKPERRTFATIGVVKYGQYTVDDKVDGLMHREVTWGGKVGDPLITVSSWYTNGTEVVQKYDFDRDVDEFKTYAVSKKLSIMCD